MDHTAWYAIPAPSVLTKGRICWLSYDPDERTVV